MCPMACLTPMAQKPTEVPDPFCRHEGDGRLWGDHFWTGPRRTFWQATSKKRRRCRLFRARGLPSERSHWTVAAAIRRNQTPQPDSTGGEARPCPMRFKPSAWPRWSLSRRRFIIVSGAEAVTIQIAKERFLLSVENRPWTHHCTIIVLRPRKHWCGGVDRMRV